MRAGVASFLIFGGIVTAVFGASAFSSHRAAVFRQATLEGTTYYRFKASYIVKETGEHVDFDYVAACAVVETTYKDGDRSMDTLGVNPKTFIKATKEGHAIQVWTPKACTGEIKEGLIPPDLFPFATFYDDVNDMSFGWGYASQDAYDNPKAKMSFEGPAAIEASTYADWKAWRTKAEAEFKPVGKIRSPWGYSYEDKDNATGIAVLCVYYKRLPLGKEYQSVITDEWIKRGRPEFWLEDDALRQRIDEQQHASGGKWNWVAGESNYNRLATVPRTKRGGIGTIEAYAFHSYDASHYSRTYDIPPTDVFPLLPHWAVVREFSGNAYPPQSVVLDLTGKFLGFAACGASEEDAAHIPGIAGRVATKPLFLMKNIGTDDPKYRFFVNNYEISINENHDVEFPRFILHANDYFLFRDYDRFSP